MAERRKLTGQHNQCPTCGLYFATNSAFDKHRVGKFNRSPPQRTCKSAAQLESEGWSTSNGFYRLKGPDSAPWRV